MKVLVILPSASLGGAERVAAIFSKECLERGDQVNVVALSRPAGNGAHLAQLRSLGSTIYNYSCRSESLGIAKFLLDLVLGKYKSYTIVYSSHLHINALVGFLRMTKLLDASFHVCRESTEIFTRFKGFRLFVYKLMYFIGYLNQDLLICQTQSMEDQLPSWIRKRLKNNIIVAPNPVSLVPLNRGESRSSIILCVCRLIPVKNVLSLVRAFELLQSLGKSGDYKLCIAGDGPLRGSIDDLIYRRSLQSSISMLGHCENLSPLYKSAKIGIIPSIKEGFPNVLLEMMAHGIPQIISTRCTQAVCEIPFVRICNSDEQSICNALLLAIESKDSYASHYYDYIKSRHSSSAFCDKILDRIHS